MKLSSLRSVKILVYRMGMGIAVFSLLAGMSSLLVSQTNPTSKTSQNRKQVPANSSTEILGNEDVVQMMRNKLNINVILNAIRDSQGHYSVTPSSLIRLNAAGVPAAVIEAMQAKAAAASTKITGIAAASGCSYLSEWVTTSRNDELTGASVVEARRQFPVATGACVEVKASCQVDPKTEQMADRLPTQANTMGAVQGTMRAISKDAPEFQLEQNVHFDARTLALQFRYRPNSPDLELLWHLRASEKCVIMGVAINGSAHSNVQSTTCNVTNLASINFPAMHLRELEESPTNAGNSVEQGIAIVLGAMSRQGADAVEGGGSTLPTMGEVIESKEILVELPLSDGNSSVVRIDPQEATFREFASKCLSALPDPPKVEKKPFPGGALGVEVEPTTLDLPLRGPKSHVVLQCLRVTTVYANSPARWTGIQLNDVIADVNGQPVSTKEQMVGALEKRNSGRAGVSLYRDGHRLDFNLELNPTNQTASSAEIPKNDYPAASASAPIRDATGGGGAAAGGSTSVGLAVPLSGEFALPLTPGHPRPGVRTGGEFLAALDNSLWVADGRPSDKQVYIIAGPCCGYSQALYRATRNITGVQMRWVEQSPTPNPKCLSYLGEIAARDDPGVLPEMYETLSEAQPASFLLRDNASRWNDGVVGAVYDMVNALNPEHPNQFRYPTVVWLSKEGVRVAVRPKNIEAILASVIPRPEATNLTSRGRSFVNASYQYQPFPQRVFLAKYEGVALYTFPDPNSQLVYRLQKDLGYYGGRRVVVAGEPWIELSLHGKGEPGLFVKEAQVYPSK